MSNGIELMSLPGGSGPKEPLHQTANTPANTALKFKCLYDIDLSGSQIYLIHRILAKMYSFFFDKETKPMVSKLEVITELQTYLTAYLTFKFNQTNVLEIFPEAMDKDTVLNSKLSEAYKTARGNSWDKDPYYDLQLGAIHEAVDRLVSGAILTKEEKGAIKLLQLSSRVSDLYYKRKASVPMLQEFKKDYEAARAELKQAQEEHLKGQVAEVLDQRGGPGSDIAKIVADYLED